MGIDTSYLMFTLSGDTLTSEVSYIPNVLMIERHNVDDAVAVRAIICTSGVKILRISPILRNSLQKEPPLRNRIYKHGVS